MITTILFTTLSVAPPAASVATPIAIVSQDEKAEAAERIAAVGDDVDKLMELAQEFKDADKDEAAREVYRKVITIDADHHDARKGLRHHSYDDQWFESYAELSRYKREEAKRMKEKGLVRFKDDWVPEGDLPFLQMGWIRQDDDSWEHPATIARQAQLERYEAEGWLMQTDLVWVPPDEQHKWQEGLIKAGDEWMTNEAAAEFHSHIGQWWTIPGQHFIAATTTAWNTGAAAVANADSIYGEMVRIFGKQIEGEKLEFLVLNSLEQYNNMAGGNQELQIPTSEASGFSSMHYAFFADALFDGFFTGVEGEAPIPVYKGTGVAYWDTNDPALAPWGPFSVRNAAAHAYMERIDPSWGAVAQVLANQQQLQPNVFWSEKSIPLWLRYGAAAYVERYMKGQNDGNPWELRDWAIEMVAGKGGVRALEQLLAFELDPANAEEGGKMMMEAGAVVSFMMDGDCAPVRQAHAAFKAALRSGDSAKAKEAGAALTQALIDNEAQLKTYLGQ